MEASIKQWDAPNFIRYYVSVDGVQVGYIKVFLKKTGYGNGYYAAHRACKCDTGVETATGYEFVGESDLLKLVFNTATSKHPNTDIDVALTNMSSNAICLNGAKKVRSFTI